MTRSCCVERFGWMTLVVGGIWFPFQKQATKFMRFYFQIRIFIKEKNKQNIIKQMAWKNVGWLAVVVMWDIARVTLFICDSKARKPASQG